MCSLGVSEGRKLALYLQFV